MRGPLPGSAGAHHAGLDSLIIEYSLMHKLGSTGLHSKIILGEGNFRLARVAVLGNKIASIASQHHVIYLALSTFWHVHHFADVSKMVCYIFAVVYRRSLNKSPGDYEGFGGTIFLYICSANL